MNQSRIVGAHVVFGMYGFWLPNDPRGSWSEFVGSYEILRFGIATTTNKRASVARCKHDHAARLAAKAALARDPIYLSGLQARAVAKGFGEYIARSSLDVWACAILPDHVHLVIGAHRLRCESIVVQLKASATRRMLAEGIHPGADRLADQAFTSRPPKCFARGQWKVFLNSSRDVERAIRYVEQNPVKEGKRQQKWSFVRRFSSV